MPDWLPPLLAAALIIAFLNLALLEQRRRARRRDWDYRLLRELRAWDGRLPDESSGLFAGLGGPPADLERRGGE
jgi:hypothetical protein